MFQKPKAYHYIHWKQGMIQTWYELVILGSRHKLHGVVPG